MKNKKIRFKAQKTAFAVTGFIFVWFILLTVAVIFTQALRNSVSYIFLIMVFSLLPIDLLYSFAAYLSVRASFSCGAETAEKNQNVEFSVTVANGFILPLPFVEAELILPDASGLQGPYAGVRIPLSPLGKSEYKKTVSFPYKGEYRCGISSVYVSGLFRFFRIKAAIEKKGSVTVLPKRIYLKELPDRYISENSSAASSDRGASGADSAEISEIKQYVPGDPIKNIHWKLSTKSQELMTKHFGSENSLHTCVISDSGKHYAPYGANDIDINEYCDDALCEICCSIIARSVNEGKNISLIYTDTHNGTASNSKKDFDGIQSFEEFLPYFASCGVSEPTNAADLIRRANENAYNDIIFVTSKLTVGTVSALCEERTSGSAVCLVIFEPYSKSSSAEELKNNTDMFLRELLSADVNVMRVSEKELI